MSCGRESPEGVKFCQSCGAILATPIDLRDRRLDEPRQIIARAVHERQRTDRQLSVLWLVAMILGGILSVILYIVILFWSFDTSFDPYSDGYDNEVAALSVFPSLLGIGLTLLFAILVYYLVKRQNEHYAREARFKRGLLALIRAAAWSPERMNDILPETMALSTIERTYEKQRNPWFWVFVVLMPQIVDIAGTMGLWLAVTGSDMDSDFSAVIGVTVLIFAFAIIDLVLLLYLFFFLTQTMGEHDARWNVLSYNARRAMTKLGFPHGSPYRANRLPERSMALYVVLTIFTGIFALYWIYVMIKDPNEHFAYQWEFEDNIMNSVNPAAYQPTAWASQQ